MTRRISIAATRRIGVATLFVVSSALLAACGGGGADSLGHQACLHVSASISAFQAAARATDPTKRKSLSATASNELSKAEPLAALAAASSGDWEALGATLGEAAHGISESNLVPALSAQCAETLGNT